MIVTRLLALLPILMLGIMMLLWQKGFTPPTTVPPAPDVKVIPDFNSFADVKAKKRAFFEFLLPMIHQANEEVERERSQLEALYQKRLSSPLTAEDISLIRQLAERYKLTDADENISGIEQLLSRIDVIPASLILAQAANESAWGTSRFARNGHNYFGIWCFKPGCGITPSRRSAGQTHEVTRFKSTLDGIRYYIYNINTHNAYRELRRIRSNLRNNPTASSGQAMAEGLLRYSERGQAYVEEIQAMIRVNQLEQYSRPAPPARG